MAGASRISALVPGHPKAGARGGDGFGRGAPPWREVRQPGTAALAMPQAAAVLPSTASPSTNMAKARACPMAGGAATGDDAASGASARLTNGVVSRRVLGHIDQGRSAAAW